MTRVEAPSLRKEVRSWQRSAVKITCDDKKRTTEMGEDENIWK